MASAEKNSETTARMMQEIWSEGNMQTIDDIIAPDFNFILPFAHMHNREEFRNLVNYNRNVFENLIYHVDDPEWDIVADDRKSACFWRMTAKHIGPWRHVPGTNKDVMIKGITYFKFNDDGQMTEGRIHNDVMSLMSQIDGIKMIYE